MHKQKSACSKRSMATMLYMRLGRCLPRTLFIGRSHDGFVADGGDLRAQMPRGTGAKTSTIHPPLACCSVCIISNHPLSGPIPISTLVRLLSFALRSASVGERGIPVNFPASRANFDRKAFTATSSSLRPELIQRICSVCSNLFRKCRKLPKLW